MVPALTSSATLPTTMTPITSMPFTCWVLERLADHPPTFRIQYIRIYGDGSNSTSSSAASGSGQNSNTDTSAAQQLLAVAALPISLVAGAATLLF